MEIALTWDLFVVVFFAIVITYSFIIGKEDSAKIIAASYIAIVAVQGMGNLLDHFAGQPLTTMGITVDVNLVSTTKILLFVAAVVFLAVRGGLQIEYGGGGGLVNSIVTGMLGFATAGLMLSTLLTFVANTPILDIHIAKTVAVAPIIAHSKLMQAMILYQDLWFSLPALLLVAVGFVNKR